MRLIDFITTYNFILNVEEIINVLVCWFLSLKLASLSKLSPILVEILLYQTTSTRLEPK